MQIQGWGRLLNRWHDEGRTAPLLQADGSPACGARYYTSAGVSRAAEEGPHCARCERIGAKRIREAPTWYVVTAQGGLVLGVYGARLLEEARVCAVRVTAQTGFTARVGAVQSWARPHVGDLAPPLKLVEPTDATGPTDPAEASPT